MLIATAPWHYPSGSRMLLAVGGAVMRGLTLAAGEATRCRLHAGARGHAPRAVRRRGRVERMHLRGRAAEERWLGKVW